MVCNHIRSSGGVVVVQNIGLLIFYLVSNDSVSPVAVPLASSEPCASLHLNGLGISCILTRCPSSCSIVTNELVTADEVSPVC
jgi:hypothetical protein